jgi:hypothetical protein
MGAALPAALARVVYKQAGEIIARLLAADAAQAGGASLKSLTLARTVRAKSATHAVCCETLKCALRACARVAHASDARRGCGVALRMRRRRLVSAAALTRLRLRARRAPQT